MSRERAEMLSNNYEEMLVIPPTNNEWTQTTMIHDDDQHHNHKVSSSIIGSTTVGGGGSRVMGKPGQELLQQQQQALKCPRCDSSNTKFCYYNNYSLSQPRHFCKACKRYWTRGGTLRNVPVGGGYRKNKHVKRHTSSSSSTTTASPPPSPTLNNSSNSNLNPPNNSNINPLFYGLPSNSNSTCEVVNNPPFPGFSSTRVSSNSGYDLLQSHHLNALGGGGLGFSSGIMSSEGSDDDNNGYRNNNGGFGTTNSNTFLSAYNSVFGFGFGSSSSSNCSPSTPVMASLLSSTLLQQKFINGSSNITAPLEESAVVMAAAAASKEVKGEGQWNHIDHHHHHVSMSDPTLYWNTASATTALGAWSDNQTNIGPSVTSLI